MGKKNTNNKKEQEREGKEGSKTGRKEKGMTRKYCEKENYQELMQMWGKYCCNQLHSVRIIEMSPATTF